MVEVEGGTLVADVVPLVLVLAEGVEVEVDEVDEVEVDEPVNELPHAPSANPATMIAAMKNILANFVDGVPLVTSPAL